MYRMNLLERPDCTNVNNVNFRFFCNRLTVNIILLSPLARKNEKKMEESSSDKSQYKMRNNKMAKANLFYQIFFELLGKCTFIQEVCLLNCRLV